MTITQVPVIDFVVGRDTEGKAIVESAPTTVDLHADTTVVALLTILDKYGEPAHTLGIPREALVQLRDLIDTALSAEGSNVNRLERRAARLAAMIAAMPPCRFCKGTSFNSFVDETGTHHRTAERNTGKCEICHGTGHSDK